MEFEAPTSPTNERAFVQVSVPACHDKSTQFSMVYPPVGCKTSKVKLHSTCWGFSRPQLIAEIGKVSINCKSFLMAFLQIFRCPHASHAEDVFGCQSVFNDLFVAEAAARKLYENVQRPQQLMNCPSHLRDSTWDKQAKLIQIGSKWQNGSGLHRQTYRKK